MSEPKIFEDWRAVVSDKDIKSTKSILISFKENVVWKDIIATIQDMGVMAMNDLRRLDPQKDAVDIGKAQAVLDILEWFSILPDTLISEAEIIEEREAESEEQKHEEGELEDEFTR